MQIRLRLHLVTTGLVAMTGLLGPPGAAADPVALAVNAATNLKHSAEADLNVKQPESRPCAVGDLSCSNPVAVDYMLMSSRTSSGVLSSGAVTAEQIRGIVGGDTFSVGLDMRPWGRHHGAFDLLSFGMSVNGRTVFRAPASTMVMSQRHRHGHVDATVFGFDLSEFSPSDRVVFFALSGWGKGRARFVLRPFAPEPGGSGGTDPSPAPEPASMILLGTGLAGALAARKRIRGVPQEGE